MDEGRIYTRQRIQFLILRSVEFDGCSTFDAFVPLDNVLRDVCSTTSRIDDRRCWCILWIERSEAFVGWRNFVVHSWFQVFLKVIVNSFEISLLWSLNKENIENTLRLKSFLFFYYENFWAFNETWRRFWNFYKLLKIIKNFIVTFLWIYNSLNGFRCRKRGCGLIFNFLSHFFTGVRVEVKFKQKFFLLENETWRIIAVMDRIILITLKLHMYP